MQVHSFGEVTTIDQVAPGSLFAFRKREIVHVAIKATGGPRSVVLWPHHPSDHSISLGLLEDLVLAGETLLLLPGAIASPCLKISELRAAREIDRKFGTLVLAGKAALTTFLYRMGEIAWIDLASGDLVFNDPKSSISFPQWEILIPQIDGTHRVICTIPAPRPATTAIAG
jgi:hypothetical protein